MPTRTRHLAETGIERLSRLLPWFGVLPCDVCGDDLSVHERLTIIETVSENYRSLTSPWYVIGCDRSDDKE